MARKYLLPVGASFLLPEGGVSLWVHLPERVDAEILCNRALEKHVLISPGSQFSIDGTERQHIRLCFAGLTDDRIEVGMKRLGEVLRGI